MGNEPLTIKRTVFFTSMKAPEDYPGGDLPEIAIAGKSNVGKSSLINYLANNSKMAYVSKQPGKTRLINYFTVNDAFYLVDLPGYGFAKVSKTEKISWAKMMEGYFDIAKNLDALIILVDIRHNPTVDDIQMIRWADYYKVPFLIVATKADKIAKSKRINYIRSIKSFVKKEVEMENEPNVTSVSSFEKKGKEDLLNYIAERLQEVDA